MSDSQPAYITQQILDQQNNINQLDNEIQKREQELASKITRSSMIEREIDYKKSLMNTRDRMLQISQEQNVYKTKVIYTYMSMIILVITILIAIYVFYSK